MASGPIWDSEQQTFVDENDNPIGGQTVAVDPAVQQVLDQNAHIAQALFDLAKVEDKEHPSNPDIQDAKTHINALNPAKFVFP